MGRKGKSRQRAKPRHPARKPYARFWLLLGISIVVVGAALYGVAVNNPRNQAGRLPTLTRYIQRVKSLDELLRMPPEQLAQIDIAEMNLLCATGLPGAESIDIAKCLARLDDWAEHVRSVTERHVYRAHDPQYADHYKHSGNWLRAEFLAQVLQEDCGIHYNMERIRAIDFKNSKDLFINGMIDDPNGGTCVSMPVIYVAVARRLGYPLRLVLTKGHIFCRWEDGQERFNIETTGNGGADSYPDEHYMTWPEPWTEADKKENVYLKPLAPAAELACFLGSRGHCLLDTGRTQAALDAYAAAHRLTPKDPTYSSWMRMAQRRLPGGTDAEDDLEVMFARRDAIMRRQAMERWPEIQGMPPPYGPALPSSRGPLLPYGVQTHAPDEHLRSVPQPYRPPSLYGAQSGGPSGPAAPGQPAMPVQP
jgi:hypothetical protein